MESVLGIGGVFFKARESEKLAGWYREMLGVPVEIGNTFATLHSGVAGEQTTWSTFPSDTDYFGPGDAKLMINYRVRDLDAMLAQLREAGVPVLDRIDDSEFGQFGWATDPEGNRFEFYRLPKSGNPLYLRTNSR